MADFDTASLSGRDRYKLLTASIVPRPIAFVSTRSADGVVNAAPFSYFNLMGHAPPIVAIGIGNRARHTPKDTALHIADRGEFVVNLVDEALGETMAMAATDFPSDVSEVERLGLELIDSVQVAVPRLAASPIQLECRHHSTTEIGGTRVVLGHIVHLHIRDDLYDAEHGYVRTEQAGLVGRMHGSDGYTRADRTLSFERIGWDEWRRRHGDG